MPSQKNLLKACLFAVALVSVSAMRVGATTATVKYTYDEVNRVTTALYDNGTCTAYSYDPNGNRTAATVTNAGAPESDVWGSGVWGCFPWTQQ